MRRTGSVLLFAAISLALHLIWVGWLPAGAPPVRLQEQWVDVSFQEAHSPALPADRADLANKEEAEVAAAETAPAAVSSSRVAPAMVGRERAREKRVVSSPSPSPSTLAPPAMGASTLQLEAAEGVEVVAAPQKPAKVPLISPRAAALSVDAFALAPALRCAAPGSSGQVGPRDCAPTDDNGEAAQAALQRDLTTIARSIPHLKAREAPELRRRSDGSYAYDGPVFQALLRPDGQVEFTDTAAQAQLSASLTPFKVVADVNDLVEHNILGRELYSAEKQWFLAQTRELRLQLSAAARRQELLAANRALERTLQAVLGDPALSASQKHDALFLIWQDCGEDAQQKAHRRAVEAFVRRYMPRDSENGFRDQELERFNRERGSLQKFEPYSDSNG